MAIEPKTIKVATSGQGLFSASKTLITRLKSFKQNASFDDKQRQAISGVIDMISGIKEIREQSDVRTVHFVANWLCGAAFPDIALELGAWLQQQEQEQQTSITKAAAIIKQQAEEAREILTLLEAIADEPSADTAELFGKLNHYASEYCKHRSQQAILQQLLLKHAVDGKRPLLSIFIVASRFQTQPKDSVLQSLFSQASELAKLAGNQHTPELLAIAAHSKYPAITQLVEKINKEQLGSICKFGSRPS